MDFLSLLSPAFFLLAAVGAVIGIIFGAIQRMTATMAVAVCLPLTVSGCTTTWSFSIRHR